jgi:hypothetical protein
VTIEDRLADASATMALMPDSAIRQRLTQLEATCRQRSGFDEARRTVELETIELDWGAYELACQYQEAGNLAAAARWFRLAAANDFSDAALRLGRVLDQRATQVSQREEAAFVAEAARWYAEAYGAGYPEAADLFDAMISRSDRHRPRPVAGQHQGPCPSRPPALPCGDGGLDAVINGRELDLAIVHFQQCTPCQREFLDRGGLLAQRVPFSHRTQEPRRSGSGGGRDSDRRGNGRLVRPPSTLAGDRRAGEEPVP